MCVCVCVFLLNFVSLFFYSGNSFTYFKVLYRSLQKKSDRTRCLAVSILEYNLGPKINVLMGPRYNINWNSKSAERAKASVWFSEGRTK